MCQVINQGKVVAIIHDDYFNEEMLIVKNEEEIVYIPTLDAGVSNGINSIGFDLEYMHNKKVNGLQYASVEKLRKLALTELMVNFDLNPNAEYIAKVLYIEAGTARLRLNHCVVSLERSGITTDPVPLYDLIKVGDELKVRIKVINKKYVQVECIERQSFEGMFEYSDLQEGDLVYGVVNGTKVIHKETEDSLEKSNLTFVTVARHVDVLAPLQTHRPVETGQEVVIKLNQVNPGKVRGKILRVFSRYSIKENLKSTGEVLSVIQVGDIVNGQVRLVRQVSSNGEKFLMLMSQGHQIIVPFSELGTYDKGTPDIGWIGCSMTVKITEVGDQIIASKRQFDQEARKYFISQWEQNPTEAKHAYVKEVGNIGYVLNIGPEEVFLLKSEYMSVTGNTELLKVTDKIYVQLKVISGDLIYVTPSLDAKEQELKKLGVTKEFLNQKDKTLHPVYQAVITKVMRKGAYLTIEGVRVFLPNSLFSLDPVRVIDIHQVGDILPVKLHSYTNNKVVVRAMPRWLQNTGLTSKELKPGMLARGVIRKIREFQNKETGAIEYNIYTSIGFKLEALSSKSDYFEVAEGDLVIFRLNQVDGKLRGRIVRSLEG